MVISTFLSLAYSINEINLGNSVNSISLNLSISYLGYRADIFIETPLDLVFIRLILPTSSIAFL